MCSRLQRRTPLRSATAIVGSTLFFVIAPGTVVGFVPWWISSWQFQPCREPLRAVGVVLILAGLPGLLDSFGRFALDGLGTPAPVAPPARLVVTGLYRHVRNPMYVSILILILGQAALLGDWRLVGYAAVLAFAFHLWVVAYEEPALALSFGAEFSAYRANVPRWLPRLDPWRQETAP